MSLLARLFSRDYRAALAAEAAGDLEAAAAAYLLCGRRPEAVRIRARLAERAGTPEARAGQLRQALEIAGDGGTAAPLRAALARTLLMMAPEHRTDAARLLEEAGEHGAAADVLLDLGRYEAARSVLAAGRQFERLEEIDRAEARRRERERRARAALDEAQGLLATGARAEALERLTEAAAGETEAPATDLAREAAALADRIRRTRPPGRVSLHLTGTARPIVCTGVVPAILGRDETSLLPLADPGVSRQHARVGIDGERFLLEDLGSRNGVLVDGLALTGPFELGESTRFALGERCLVDFSRVGVGAAILRVERGLSVGARAALLCGFAPLSALDPLLPSEARIGFAEGWFVLEAPSGVRLGDCRTTRVQLLNEDRIDLGGPILEVRT